MNYFEEIKDIYNGVYDDKLDRYPYLKPYRDILLLIFEQFPLFSRIDDTGSMRFVKRVIDLVTQVPENELGYFNERLLSKCCYYQEYLEYLETLINPKEASSDIGTYLYNFDDLFDTEMAVLAACVRLTPLNNINRVMPQAYYAILANSKNRFIIELVTACLYANQDILDLETVGKFYDNFDEYAKHLTLHFNYTDCQSINMFIRLHDRNKYQEPLTMMYKSILNTLYQIKNNGYQKTIK